MESDKLLDVFVGVRPDDTMIKATEDALKATAENIRKMFGDMNSTAVADARSAANQINAIAQQAAQRSAAAAAAAAPGGGGAGGGGGGSGSRSAGANGPNVSAFEAAKRLAEDLNEQITVMKSAISTIGVDRLTGEFRQMEAFIDRIAVVIDRQRKDGDILGITSTSQRLRELEQQLRAFQTRAVLAGDARQDFNVLVGESNKAIQEERIRNKLATSLIRGLPSGETRTQIVGLSAEVQKAEREVKRLQKAFDGTAESVERLKTATVIFKESAAALGEAQDTARQQGASFNTLTNNAYQLGQAIEDAAVGFSLNGFAGAVRGAANNVAFLLNDMSKIPAVQKQVASLFGVTETTAKNLVPLVAGIGSALAITVLPPMIEWLESLNDIEQKFIDIKNSVNAITKDRGTEDAINRTTESLRDFARNAESVTEISKKILSIRSEIVTLQEEITGSVRAFGQQDVFQGFTKGIDEFRAKLDSVTETLSKQNQVFNDFAKIQGPLGGDPSQIERGFAELNAITSDVTGLQNSIRSVSQAIAQVRAEGDQGIVSTDSLREATKSLRELQEFVTKAADPTSELFDTLDLGDGVAEKLSENVDTLTGAIEDLTNKSREAERAQQDMADAIIFSQNAVRRLVDDSQLELEALQGLVPESATFLRQIERASEASKRLQESIRGIADRGFLAKDLADRAIANEQEATSLQNRIALTERLNSIKEKLTASEERISSLNERQAKDQRSQLTTLEQIAQSVQSNALSVFAREEAERKKLDESLKNEVLERQKLIDQMRVLNEAYANESNPAVMQRLSRIPANRYPVDAPGFSKDRDFARAWLEPLLRDVIAKQSDTAKEVREKDMSPRAQ